MITKHQLKENLTRIKQNNFLISKDERYDEYAKVMLRFIGDTDPILRDSLIYEVFNEWIVHGRFNNEQLTNYLLILINSEHLLYKIGEKDTDFVYTRTFSALILTSIIERHLIESFLTKPLIMQLFDIAVLYYREEKDLRGYTQNSGWAHPMAHGADLLKALSACSELDKDKLAAILNVIKSKICQGDYVYIEREPNRMSHVVSEIYKRNLFTNNEFSEWVQSFINTEKDSSSITSFHERVNIGNFLRCLYFELRKGGADIAFLDIIEAKTDI